VSSQDDAPITTLRATTRLVVLDVVVTGKSGKPAPNLTKDDFTILEDGKPQAIASFERPQEHRYTLSASGPTPGNPRGESVSPALTILVIDTLNTQILDQAYAREMVTKFLQTHGPKLPQPTALMLISDTRLELLHDYTQDAAALHAALKNRHAELPFRLGANDLALGETERLLDTLTCLEQIAAANMNFAGRKNVIWIGQGFPALHTSNAITQTGSAPDTEFQRRLISLVSRTANEMWDARLAIYTIDPRGLQNHSPGVLDDPSGQRVFESVATESGGKMFFNRNDVDVAVNESVNDGASYYTLSYYPANRDWNGKLRNLKVTLAAPGLVARTRTGYYATPDAAPTDPKIDAEITEAVKNPLTYRGLGLSVSYKVLPGNPRTARFAVAVNRHDLGWDTTPNGDRRCQIMLDAMSVSGKELIAKNEVKALQGIVEAKKFDKQMDKPMIFTFTGDLPPNAVRLRIVVRDSKTGNIGSANLAVTQP
jgi:VWFA-related protein